MASIAIYETDNCVDATRLVGYLRSHVKQALHLYVYSKLIKVAIVHDAELHLSLYMSHFSLILADKTANALSGVSCSAMKHTFLFSEWLVRLQLIHLLDKDVTECALWNAILCTSSADSVSTGISVIHIVPVPCRTKPNSGIGSRNTAIAWRTNNANTNFSWFRVRWYVTVKALNSALLLKKEVYVNFCELKWLLSFTSFNHSSNNMIYNEMYILLPRLQQGSIISE